MAIKAVLTDLGYTLIYNTKYELYQDVLKTEVGIERTLDEVDFAFHMADKHIMRYMPGIFMSPFYSYGPLYVGIVNFFLDIKPDLLKCAAGYNRKHLNKDLRWRQFPGVSEALKRLRDMGLTVILVTNWDKSCRDALKEVGLLDSFDDLVVSSEFGSEKPEPHIINKAVELSGFKKEECLFVGDNYYDDGVGSERAGLDYVIVNRFGRVGTEELSCKMLTYFTDIPDYIAGLQK